MAEKVKSKFFADSDSESEEDVPEETGDFGDEEGDFGKKPAAPQRMGADDAGDFSDGEGGASGPVKRVVRSQRDRLREELVDHLRQLRRFVSAREPDEVTDVLDALQRTLANKVAPARAAFLKDGGSYPPPTYLRCLNEVRTYVDREEEEGDDEGEEEEGAEGEAGDSAAKKKQLKVLKQKLRKAEKPFEADLKKFRENPSVESDEDEMDGLGDRGEETESDHEEEEEEVQEPKKQEEPKKKGKWFVAEGDEEEEEEEEVRPAPAPAAGAEKPKKSKWFTTEDDEEEEEEDKKAEEVPQEKTKKSKWFTTEDDEEEEGEKQKVAPQKTGRNKWFLSEDDEGKKEDVEDEESAEEDAGDAKKRLKKAKADEEKKAQQQEAEQKEPEKLTQEMVAARASSLISNLGRKGPEAKKIPAKLAEFLALAESPLLKLQISVAIATVQFNTHLKGATARASPPQWRLCRGSLVTIFSMLDADPSLVAAAKKEADAAGKTFDALDAAPTSAALSSTAASVLDSLVAYVERLDDSLTAMLQEADVNKPEYATRLALEPAIEELERVAQQYYNKVGDRTLELRLASRRIEHIYYKAGEKAAAELAGLTSFLLRHGTERQKSRAVLCSVYNHAIGDEYFVARDLLLRTHLQEGVHEMDIPTQILYNRTQAHIALCAFRLGMFAEAHAILSELYATQSSRELLGQGFSQQRFYNQQAQQPVEHDAKQEMEESRRQVPGHMQISTDLLEAAILVSSMILEVPQGALHAATGTTADPKRRSTFRYYHRMMDYADSVLFSGPPQNTRDFVIMASRAMQTGDWRGCCDALSSLKIWGLLGSAADAVRSLIFRKVQEEALRTFLLLYSQHYQSLSVARLVDMFGLPESCVHSLISRMVTNEELRASFDQPTSALVPHHVEPSRLQSLSVLLADKVSAFVDSNEHLLDARTGVYGFKDGIGGPSGPSGGFIAGGWLGRDRGSYQHQHQHQYQQGGQQSGGHQGSQRGGKHYQSYRGRPRYAQRGPHY